MGAYYDITIVPSSGGAGLSPPVEEFLGRHDLRVEFTAALGAVEISNTSVVLVSPSYRGCVQVLADCNALGISGEAWYGNNPLAAFLSRTCGYAVHIWTLNSGYASGYSAFENGQRLECDYVFSKYATRPTEIMDNVPIPSRCIGRLLARLIDDENFDFLTELSRHENLEVGCASVICRFGFDVHLVDLHDALEECEGVAVRHGEYVGVPLNDWTAIKFSRKDLQRYWPVQIVLDMGIARTDLVFGFGDEKTPVILCGHNVGEILMNSSLNGIVLNAARFLNQD